jgi:predicted Mrr-cat superfamily restriction endonuclease
MRKAGADAGHMWHFIREMNIGDLVVVPYRSDFYVEEIKGSASYDEAMIGEDTAYRRDVQWLNDKKAIPRQEKTVRGGKGHGSPSTGHGRAGICGSSTSQTLTQKASS